MTGLPSHRDWWFAAHVGIGTIVRTATGRQAEVIEAVTDRHSHRRNLWLSDGSFLSVPVISTLEVVTL